MDRYLTLFGPLVWPLATLVIALIFRKDVSVALGRIGQVKYRDLELTFHDDLHKAEQLARSIPPPTGRGPIVHEVADDETKPLVGRLIVAPTSSYEPLASPIIDPDLTGRPPRETVEAAWSIVARALSRASKEEGDRRASASTNPDVAVRFLFNRGKLGRPEILLVGLLRSLRDRAARVDELPPTADEARRFVELAQRVASRIEELGGSAGEPRLAGPCRPGGGLPQ